MIRRGTGLFVILFCSGVFTVSTDSCTETQCQVLVDDSDTSTEFQLLATKEGVRIVYLNLEFANANGSYNPFDTKKIMPFRWAWTQSNSEPLLSFSYDYDVLSLGLLTNQARKLTVKLIEVRRGCLAGLNSSCQDTVIARALMVVITSLTARTPARKRMDVVCTRVLQEHSFGFGSNFKYQCCGEYTRNNDTMINCDVGVKESKWLALFNSILAALVTITSFYWPLLLCMLPTSFFNEDSPTEFPNQSCIRENRDNEGQTGHELVTPCEVTYGNETNQERESRNIPLDDLSPITFGMMVRKFAEQLPTNTFALSMKLCFLWFGFIPVLFYTKLGLYFIVKDNYFDATSRKLIFQVGDFYLYVFSMDRPLVYVIFVLPFFIIPCATILFWRTEEKQTFATEKSNGIGNIKKNILSNMQEMSRKSFYMTRASLLYLFKRKFLRIPSRIRDTACQKTSSLLFFVVLLIVVPIFAVAAVIIFVLISITCLIVFSPYITLLKSAWLYAGKPSQRLLKVFIFILMVYSTLSASIIVIFSCQFVVRMLGFIIMGIILNAEFAVPYVTFGFVVTRNIFLCFRNFQNRYKEIKDIIAEKWKEKKGESDTIPTKLFLSVCKKVLPFPNELCLMFRNIVAILIFLSIALTAILLFKVTYNSSAIVSTISVFISGKFSELFFTRMTAGHSFIGWEKIRKKKAIQYAIEDFIAKKETLSDETTTC